MKQKPAIKYILSEIFCGVSSFLSVYVFALLSKVAAPPKIKLLLDVIVIVLLLSLNTAVVVLLHQNRQLKKRLEEAEKAEVN